MIWALGLCAQYPAIEHYSVEDGLPSSHIYYTLQDSKGFIWVCTDKGLALFDGYQFKVFTVKDGLPSNDVWSVAEDEQGRIWLSTFNKLVYYKNSRFHIFQENDSLLNTKAMYEHQIDRDNNHFINNKYSRLLYYRDRNDSLFVFDYLEKVDTKSLLFKERKETAWFFKPKREQLKEQPAFGSLIYANDEYIIDSMGLYNIIIQLSQLYYDKHKIYEYSIKTSKDKLCVRTEDKISVYNNDTIFQRYSTGIFGPNTTITKLEEYAKGYFLVGGNNQYKILDSNLQVIPNFNFINDYNLNTFYKDKNGNWFFNTSNGLYFLAANALTSKSFPQQKDKLEIKITSIKIDINNTIWLGTENGVIYRLKNNKLEDFFFTSLAQGKIQDILIDSKGFFYICGNRIIKIHGTKLNKLLDQKPNSFNDSDFILKDNKMMPLNIKKVYLTQNDELYISAGVYIYKYHNNILSRHTKNGNQRFYSLVISPKNQLLLGSKTGVYTLINEKPKKIKDTCSVLNLPINDLQIDNSGKLWIASDGYGLYRYYEENVDTIAQLQNEIVSSLTIENDSTIWASTNHGVCLINIKKNNPFVYHLKRITTAHGLISRETNKVVIKEDSVYVATNKGLTILDKNIFNKHTEQPILIVNNITINDQKKDIKSSYEIKHNQNNITIEYICLSYKSKKDITYFYKMDGIDDEWKTTKKLELRYPILPPDDYKLHLKALDIDGAWTSEIASISFIIHPPWWQKLWFKITLILLLLLSFATYIQYYTKTIKQKAAAENDLNKKFAELELKALQAQMNPHFVFNALNAIQEFIFKKEERVANKFIVKFSRLMRLFLESSKEKYIKLEDELELLRLYIDIEQVRFINKFDYKIKIGDTINPGKILLPSMLLQPFVENAINHGLILSDKKGLLTIDIQTRKNKLIILIEDDGIGRLKAMQIRKQSFKSYKSRGTQIVEERQRVLNFIESAEIEINTIDYTENIHHKTGTKVEVILLYNHID